jgi:glutathione S-transferase
MALKLFGHPFSSYTQKALIALYENQTPFAYQELGGDPAIEAEHLRLWPIKKMPTLEDRGRVVVEATIIIEYLDLHHPGPVRMLPADPKAALDVRTLDRVFDNYVMTPMQKIVFDYLRPADQRNPADIADGRALLEKTYAWLEHILAGRPWAAGDAFGLADCAAAPSLFYADWVHPIDARHANLRAYRSRLLARASVKRCVDEARPYRKFFPPGAPDRD